VWGATIAVNTTEPGIFEDGLCSLEEAIENANEGAVHSDCVAGNQGLDVVDLGHGATYTLEDIHHEGEQGFFGLPAITSSLLINGHGSVLERAETSSDFGIVEVLVGFVSLNDLTIRRGLQGVFASVDARLHLNRCVVTECSIGIQNEFGEVFAVDSLFSSNRDHDGIGVSNFRGVVSLVDSTVTDNRLGIYSSGLTHLTLIGCEVTDNRGDRSGAGGVYTYGGKVFVRDSVISGNAALSNEVIRACGGGISSYSSVVEIEDSLITGNHADFCGGGINLSREPETSPSFRLVRSTVSGNTAKHGAGVWIRDVDADISSSTISGNEATEDGGGIGIRISQFSASLVVESSTISDNSAAVGGGMFVDLEVPEHSVRVTFERSIMAGNSVNCVFDDGVDFTSEGTNLGDDTTCTFDHPTDMIVDDVMLSELGDYGGPTPVHMPLEGSPAIDMGGECSRTDQRGYLRPVDGDGDGVTHCDCGAVEAGAMTPPRPVVPDWVAVE
jgi:hypothetical protein